MNEYYLEKVRDTERQVKFAKVGYEAEIKALGKRLTECPLEESEAIIEEIKALIFTSFDYISLYGGGERCRLQA